MKRDGQVRVAVHAYGGWWNDSEGRTGKVSEELAGKGPMFAVAVVSNGLGKDGWELTAAGPRDQSAPLLPRRRLGREPGRGRGQPVDHVRADPLDVWSFPVSVDT
jgi:hypothetical protein